MMPPPAWQERLDGELKSEQWSSLVEFVHSERAGECDVYPPADSVFRALQLVEPEDVRVVILGQDPYHGPGQADGLSFSTTDEVPRRPALRNIFKEWASDLGSEPPATNDLAGWARQGVLMLNTSLTVRRGEPGSHAGQGWEEFTDAVIRTVNELDDRVVFILWGKNARSKKRIIDSPPHEVIESAHPTSYPSAKDPFAGSRPFSRTNAKLEEWGRGRIDWTGGVDR